MNLSPLFTWRSAVMDPSTTLSASARYVALALSLHMNERGDSCFPSLETLEAEVRHSRNHILDALRELEAGEWLHVQRPPGKGGRGLKNHYRATIPEGFTGGTVFVKRVHGVTQKGSPGEPEDVKEDVKDPEPGQRAHKQFRPNGICTHRSCSKLRHCRYEETQERMPVEQIKGSKGGSDT